MKRPNFIKHIDELIVEQSLSYPGDTETFGIGAAMGRKLGLSRIGINYEILRPGDCIGLPPGTGHAEDKIFYPLHPNRNEDCKKGGWLWENHPSHELKNHDGISDSKRFKNRLACMA